MAAVAAVAVDTTTAEALLREGEADIEICVRLCLARVRNAGLLDAVQKVEKSRST